MTAPDTSRTPATTQTRRSTACSHRELKIIQEQLGHSWGSTTAIYTSVGTDYKNKALRRALDRAFEAD